MELVFEERTLRCLNRICCEQIAQEQTAELIVPDSYADAQRVVDAFGTALLRTQECANGAVSAAGTVQAGVLLVTEEGRVVCLDAQIPFAIRHELPEAGENAVLQCSCELNCVDARLLNSRKVLIRVAVSCRMEVYARQERNVPELCAPAPNLQLRRLRLPLQMPLALGERSFTLNEEVELPAGKPALARLLRVLYQLQVPEQKTVGSKAVFKGAVTAHVLYEDAEGELQAFEQVISFSQYAELDCEPPEGTVQTVLSLTGAEAEQETQSDCRRLLLSLQLLAQCVAYGEQQVELICDAYCTDALLTPQYAQWEMTGILDRQSFHDTLLATADVPARRVVDAWVCPDLPQQQRHAQELCVELPLHCNVLYYDTDGALQGESLRPVLRAQTLLAERGSCRISQLNTGALFCAAGPGGLELRCPLGLELESFAAESLRTLSSAEITPDEPGARRPSLLLRRTTQPEEVWALAKACRSVASEILRVNALESETIPADTLLLIPM